MEILILLFVIGLLAAVGVFVALAVSVGLLVALASAAFSLVLPALAMIALGWLLVTVARAVAGRGSRHAFDDADWLDT